MNTKQGYTGMMVSISEIYKIISSGVMTPIPKINLRLIER